MSYLTLVNDALSLIGVLPEGQDASADQGTLALRVAVEMVADWEDEGVTVTFPSSATLSGSHSLAGTELNAVKYGLAVRLCPYFGREPSGTLAALAVNAWNRLARQQMAADLEPSNALLPQQEGKLSGWDILS